MRHVGTIAPASTSLEAKTARIASSSLTDKTKEKNKKKKQQRHDERRRAQYPILHAYNGALHEATMLISPGSTKRFMQGILAEAVREELKQAGQDIDEKDLGTAGGMKIAKMVAEKMSAGLVQVMRRVALMAAAFATEKNTKTVTAGGIAIALSYDRTAYKAGVKVMCDGNYDDTSAENYQQNGVYIANGPFMQVIQNNGYCNSNTLVFDKTKLDFNKATYGAALASGSGVSHKTSEDNNEEEEEEEEEEQVPTQQEATTNDMDTDDVDN